MEESNDITTPPSAPTPEAASPATPETAVQPATSETAPPAASGTEPAESTSSVAEQSAATLQPAKGEEPEQQPGGLFDSPMIWVILGAVWLWALWSMRKNKKKQQVEQERQQELFRKGARVVTIGRLHGTIVSFNDKTVTIKPDEKRDLTLTFDRNAILQAASDTPAETDNGTMKDNN